MSTKKNTNSNAERLKAQGNEFHQKGQYKAAQGKYTDAIKEDPKNAIYYANRAASSLALKEYLDAAADARVATNLDPNYAKAWSRLGSATYNLVLRRYPGNWGMSQSVDAWETALKCLPPLEQSSEQDKKLRSQFTEGLAKSKEALNTPLEATKVMQIPSGQKFPWHRAAAIEQELLSAQRLSSGFVVLQAYREFKAGVETMRALKKQPINGVMGYFGKPTALVDLTNALLRDHRVFHMDSSDWQQKYNEQVVFEAERHKAWVHGGAKTVQEEAVKRLRKEGWNSVRPALSTTVRAWIMCGFFATSFGKHQSGIEYYSRAIEMLEWGSHKWRDVSVIDRGVIFEKTFIRGAKRLKITAMHACLANKVQGLPFTTDDVLQFCRDVIAETNANPPGPPQNGEFDPSFLASFWMYPKAEAYSTLAWHYMQVGHEADNAEDAQAAYTQSAEFYLKSAQCHPQDDESALIFYKVGKKLEEQFALTNRMKQLLPDVLRIWEFSAASEHRDGQLCQAFEFEERCHKAVKQGTITLDNSLVRPKELETKCKWKEGFVYI